MDAADQQFQLLLDKQAITKVIYRYGRSMDRLDRDFDQSGPSTGDIFTRGRLDRLDASYFPVSE